VTLVGFLVTPTLQNTEFSSNGTVAVTNVLPCHLYGDADLYGKGVRYSFYLQCVAAIFASALHLKSDLHNLRVGFNLIMLSVLVALIRNTMQGSLVMLEWYIVYILVILLPGYAFWPTPIQTQPWSKYQQDYIREPKEPKEHDTGDTAQTLKGALTQYVDDAEEYYKKAYKDAEEYYIRWLRSEALSLGILQLLYTVYFALQPWLYFKLLNQGRKEGCTVKIFAFFTYIDIWNSHWVAFTKFNAVLSVIGAFGVFVTGSYITLIGLYFSIYDAVHKEDSCMCEKPCRCCPVNREKDQDTEERDAGLPKSSQATCPCDSCPCDQEDKKADPGYGVLADREKIRKDIFDYYIILHFIRFLVQRAWQHIVFVFFAFMLVSGLSFVEKTIESNHIDIPGGGLKSASQILPFVVGLATSVNVFKSAFIKLIAVSYQFGEFVAAFVAARFDPDSGVKPIWPIPRMQDERGNNVYSFPELPLERFWEQPNFELARRVDNETTPALGAGEGHS